MSATPTLDRAVSRWQIVALALNNVVGSGVYLLPAAAAAALGALSLWAVLAAGVAVLLVVLCFAEAASHFDRAGGAYLYTRVAFGDLAGFEVGWLTWLASLAASAALSAGFAQALSYFWPAVAAGWPRALAVTLPLLALTAANVVGVRSGAWTAVALTILKILPLLLFVALGLFAVSPARAAAARATDGSTPAVTAGILLLLFAYAGFENAPAAAGEYKDPKKNVAFALLTQIAIVTLLYFAVQWVALGTLPNLGASRTPLADAARRFLGPAGGTLLAIGSAVSILGTNGNQVLAGPRYLFALARDGFGPGFLGEIHPRFRTPAAAILLQSALALPLALTGSFARLAATTMLALIATYLGTAASVPILRRKLPAPPAGFRLPGGPAIPIAAGLLCLALATSATRADVLAGGIAAVVGLLLYLFRRPAAPDPDPEAAMEVAP